MNNLRERINLRHCREELEELRSQILSTTTRMGELICQIQNTELELKEEGDQE